MMRAFLAFSLFLVSVPAFGGEKTLPVLFEDSFKDGASQWEMTDPKAWRVDQLDAGSALHQFQMSKYSPPYRSPLNRALVKGLVVSDFELHAKVKSTGKDGAHRDMCLFFGYQDPAKLYYVHIAKKADDHANQIFIVNKEARKKISTKSTAGTPWDDQWHHVKVARDVKKGSIEIYFDDMKTPIMTATDTTFTWGQVGVGSFDDSGYWREIRVLGRRHEK